MALMRREVPLPPAPHAQATVASTARGGTDRERDGGTCDGTLTLTHHRWGTEGDDAKEA